MRSDRRIQFCSMTYLLFLLTTRSCSRENDSIEEKTTLPSGQNGLSGVTVLDEKTNTSSKNEFPSNQSVSGDWHVKRLQELGAHQETRQNFETRIPRSDSINMSECKFPNIKGCTNSTQENGYSKNASFVTQHDFCISAGKGDSCKNPMICSCSDECVIFENCCFDAKPKPLYPTYRERLKQLMKRSTCQHVITGQWYKLVSTCPSSWTNQTVRSRCERFESLNLIDNIPIYVADMKISFRNTNCAKCNLIDDKKQISWLVNVSYCSLEFMLYKANDGFVNFIERIWRNGTCRIDITPRIDMAVMMCLEGDTDLYKCAEQDKMALKSNLTNVQTAPAYASSSANPLEQAVNVDKEIMCYKYQNVIATKDATNRIFYFRNPFCAWCLDLKYNVCTRNLPGRKRFHSIRVLLDFSSVIKHLNHDESVLCKENEIYDDLLRTCRPLTCISRYTPSYGSCIRPYDKVMALHFRQVVLFPCELISRKLIKNAIIKTVNEIAGPMFLALEEPYWSKNGQAIEIEDGVKFCDSKCLAILVPKPITFEQVQKLTQLSALVLGVFYRNNISIAMVVNVSRDVIECSRVTNDVDEHPLQCPFLTMNEKDFISIINILKTYSLSLDKTKFVQLRSKYYICYHEYEQISEKIKQQATNSSYHGTADFESVASLALISASLSSLVVTIGVYLFHPELQSTPCKICLNIMLCLSSACLLFIISVFLDKNEFACYVIAIMSHFTWLCTFAWSVVYGIHLVSVFGFEINFTSLQKLRRRNRCNCRLFAYAGFAYSIPFLITCVSVMLDSAGVFQVQYGSPVCFINNSRALLYWFGIPVMTCLVVNVICFCFTIQKMYSFSPGKKTFSQQRSSVLKSAVKMFFCLSLTWVFGPVASFTDSEALWFLHTILNSSHGVFIFISYIVCSDIALKWLNGKWRMNRNTKSSGRGAHTENCIHQDSKMVN